MQRTVLTIATGKKLYIDMACNLARSFWLWNADSGIDFHIATDQPEGLADDVKEHVKTIMLNPGELGEGFSSKLYLDKLAQNGQTLFIDADCLIFGNLENVFERFQRRPVSVVGGYIANGEWFGDTEKICRAFNVPHMPKFNGGIYYLEKGETASQVYQTARDLEKRYDDIGFVRLRNRPNDEVLISLAMQLHNQVPIPDDGTILSDPQACPGGYSIDVLDGKRWLYNPPAPHKLHREWYPFTRVSPLVVHLLGPYTNDYPYKREVFKLKKAINKRPAALTTILAFITIEAPARAKTFAKNVFRPVYHLLFGVRKAKLSDRI